MTDIGVAGGENDPNIEEVRILTTSSGAMFRVFAPRYIWKCYDFLIHVSWCPKELADMICKWSMGLQRPFEEYFEEAILYLYHSILGNNIKAN